MTSVKPHQAQASEPYRKPVCYRIRTLIAEDSELMRETICLFLQLQRTIEVVGSASDSCEARMQAVNLRPDVVVMDLQMRGENGFQMVAGFHEQFPDIPAIVISDHDLIEERDGSLASGAASYVPKAQLHLKLISEIERVAPSREADQQVVNR